MNVTLNASPVIHTASTHEGQILGTRCSAENLRGKKGYRKFRKTADAVTCKRCLKMAAKRDATPAAPTPVAAAPTRELKVFYTPSKRTHSEALNAWPGLPDRTMRGW